MDLFTLGLLQKNLSGNKGDIKSKNGESSYTITDAVDFPVLGLNLYGKSTQDGTPTPDAPVDIVSVGDNGFDIVSQDDTHFNLLSVRDNGGDIITKQPVSIVDKFGNYVEVPVVATGTGLKYQWQVSTDEGQTWKDSNSTGNNTSTLSLTISSIWDGVHLRCVITDANGKAEISNDVVIYAVLDDCEITTAAITSALPLYGIPVESGGNYTDSNGQQWVCDELVYNADGTGKIIKRTVKIIFDGSEDEGWTTSSSQTSGKNRIFTKFIASNVFKSQNNTNMSRVICDNYSANSASNTYFNINGISIDAVGSLIIYDDERSALSAAEWKALFAENPITVVYALAEPQEIPLSAAEMTALRQLMTYNGTTNISNSDNSDMDVKYCINQVMADYYPIFAGQGADVQPLVLFEGTDEGYTLADGFTGFSVYYTDTLPTEEERITISKICADDSTTESRYGYLISKLKSIDNSDYNYTDSAVISSNEMVDLTNYKTLCIDFYGLASYNTTASDEKDNISNSAYFRIDRPDTLPQSHISYDWTGWDNMGMYYRNHNKYYFDVSQISGEHYLCFGIFHGNYSKYYLNGIKIYKITLM